MPKYVSPEEKLSRLRASRGTRYEYDTASLAVVGKIIRIHCPEHGWFTQNYYNHLNGADCPQCRGRGVDWVQRFRSVHGDRYGYDRVVFRTSKAPVEIVCPEHGSFWQSPTNHYTHRQGCPGCRGARISQSKQRLSPEEFIRRAREVHGDAYRYTNVAFQNMLHTQVPIWCIEHGVEFTQTVVNHLAGKRGCPQCNHMASSGEAEVAALLAPYGAERRVRGLLGNAALEVDVYLPSVRVGVEYHGLYWHGEKRMTRLGHRDKWQQAQTAGIRLVQIFEDEWQHRRSAVTNRLLALVGAGPRYHARKCQVVTLESSKANAMLDEWHTQGRCTGQLFLGLEYAGEVVAVAAFGAARTGGMVSQGSGVYEVLRYASKGRVMGGFSKLFKQFVQTVQPREVVSYCDLRYGDGSMYAACGFTLERITDPDYWWVPRGKHPERVPRYRTQKHKLAKHPVLGKYYAPEKTEVQICHDAGWYRIYGVGHQRWVWYPTPESVFPS